jgi:DNA-binding transcriptional LysR family regulator
MSGKALLGQLSDVDVRLLRVFRVIVECGGMSAAELELNISRSAISRHLKDLEIRLGGLTLCRRGRAGFALTEEGQQIYDATLRLQSAMDAFRSDVNQIHQHMTGSITIAMGDHTVTNPDAHIGTALRMFGDRAPEMTLEMHVQPLNAIEPRVMDGTYQIGIVPMHRESSCLDYYPLFSESMRLYCSSLHPLYGLDHSRLDWHDIRKYRYAGLGYHSPNMELAHKAGLARSATAYDQEAVLTLITSGDYVGFLPSHFAKDFVQRGHIRQLNNDRFSYRVSYAAIVRRVPEPPRSVQTMIHCLQNAHKKNDVVADFVEHTPPRGQPARRRSGSASC